jgi:tetratricopeptide (TPR) repeat protein
MQQNLARLEQQVRTETTNSRAAFDLATLYIQFQRTNDALTVFDRLLNQPGLDVTTVLSLANVYAQLQQGPRLEQALRRLVEVNPDSPEAWYDLASTQSILAKPQDAVQSLARALALSDARRAADPTARDLRASAPTNLGFGPLRALPEFQRLLQLR